MTIKKSRKNRLAPFVPIFLNELDSDAYRNLTPSAAKLLPYFKRACSRACKGPTNENTIFGFTYTEATKLGFSRGTFGNAMKDLEKNGFIETVSTGGLRGAGHSCSRYRLSKRWLTVGGLAWAQRAHREAGGDPPLRKWTDQDWYSNKGGTGKDS